MMVAIVFALLGAYCIFTGVKLLLTGKLPAVEEERLKAFSQKGAGIYKLAYAGFSIIGGLIVAALGVIKYLEEQHIIPNSIWYNIVALAIVAVMTAIFFLVRSNAKKLTDDE